jgi:uncharacterized membrane protein YccC
METPDIDVQKGLIALLGALATGLMGLLGWRGFGHVRHGNAQDALDSRLQENLAKRLEAETARADKLQERLTKALDGRRMLERQLHDQKRRTQNLLELLAPEAREAVERWVEDSAFPPFDSGPGKL